MKAAIVCLTVVIVACAIIQVSTQQTDEKIPRAGPTRPNVDRPKNPSFPDGHQDTSFPGRQRRFLGGEFNHLFITKAALKPGEISFSRSRSVGGGLGRPRGSGFDGPNEQNVPGQNGGFGRPKENGLGGFNGQNVPGLPGQGGELDRRNINNRNNIAKRSLSEEQLEGQETREPEFPVRETESLQKSEPPVKEAKPPQEQKPEEAPSLGL